MLQSKIFIFFVLLGGIGVGAWVSDALSEATPPPVEYSTSIETPAALNPPTQFNDQNSAATISELRQQLEAVTTQNQQLLNELSTLQAQLDESQSDEKPARIENPQEAVKRGMIRRTAGGLTVESLVAAGINERDASSMKSHLDDLAMQRLYLRDQATRTGVLGKKEYREEMRRLNEAQNNLASEFGEDNYSRYLYAMGRPNKVDVQSVIGNSPAFNAGLESGDRIVSYDGQTIYGANDVRRGTQRGEYSELVPIVVERNGQQINLYVPRGPLGIQMTSESVRPPDGP